MKLAFNKMAHYPDFEDGYTLYLKRKRTDIYVDKKTYKRIIKRYCRILVKSLIENGIIDLPCSIGSIVAARITRKPQYRGKTFVGYGKKDWKTGLYDGNLKTFGIVFLPNRKKHKNIRGLGFVANRELFKTIKDRYEKDKCSWELLDFNDEMI